MNLVKSFFSGGREGAQINFLTLGLTLVAMIWLLLGVCVTVWGLGVFGDLISHMFGYKPIMTTADWLLLLVEQTTFRKTVWCVFILLFEISFGGFCHYYTKNGLNDWTKKKRVEKIFAVGSVSTIWLLFSVQASGTLLLSLANEPSFDLLPPFCSVLLIPLVGVFAICLAFETLIFVGIWVSKCFKDNKSCNLYIIDVWYVVCTLHDFFISEIYIIFVTIICFFLSVYS